MGYLAATVASRALKARLFSLECDVADLQDKILVEIKKRAGQESGKSRKGDAELLAKLQTSPPKPVAPWWFPFVTSPELREDRTNN